MANDWNGWKLVRSLPRKWAGMAASSLRSFAINEKGELYGWGGNYRGRLGDGTADEILCQRDSSCGFVFELLPIKK